MGKGAVNHRMKIAFVNDIVHGYAMGASVVGGAERQQWLLARALAAKGWSVSVGVREALGAGERHVIDGVEFVGIGDGRIQSAWYRFLAAERPDWWYWRCASHLWGIAVEVAKVVGVRTVFAAGFDTDVRPCRALVRRSNWWPLYAWGLSRTDRILVQHGQQLNQLPRRWRAKACVVRSIAGPIALDTPHAERGEYVAWVAMLRQPKRPDLLIEVARRAPGIRFVVCGGTTTFACPPGYGERIVSALRAQENIEFLGRKAPQQARHIIADAAMLLSTSDAEGFPNTFLEAWSSGTPVVSLKIDPDGIIERQQLGRVSGSVESAAADIAQLMASPRQRDDVAARCRRYVAEAHSASAIVAQFERAVA
jgi:glycosyltransferase involved in cell wall biosynthesis